MISAGVRLLEGMIDSGQVALGELEKGLTSREAGSDQDMQVIVESVAKGYGAFFREMTRTTRLVSEHYRSDSGKLVGKPGSGDPPAPGFSARDGERNPTESGR